MHWGLASHFRASKLELENQSMMVIDCAGGVSLFMKLPGYLPMKSVSCKHDSEICATLKKDWRLDPFFSCFQFVFWPCADGGKYDIQYVVYLGSRV